MLDILYIPFGYVLKFCCIVTGNYYVLALLLFALIMQVLLFPLGIKQQKSSVSMAKMRPKEQLIREKYKGRNDRPTQQKMQQEIQELYQKEGYSPLSGCLPLLIQLPIILALFGVVRQPLTYTVASSDFDVDKQYQTAVVMLEEAKNAIDASGLLEVKYTDTQLTEKQNQTELIAIKTELYTLQKYFGATIDEKGVWNKETALSDSKSNYEMNLASFMIKEAKATYNEALSKYGIANAITTDFDQTALDELPTFTFIGSYSFLDTPKNFFGFNVLMLIPILVFVSSFFGGVFTRKWSPMPANANGATPGNGALMKWGMPAMSAYFSFTFPAAIGLYWVYRTILSTVQQYILIKMYPLPVVTEAELEEIKKQMKGKKKKVITIEVDEDDSSYDNLVVSKRQSEALKSENCDRPAKPGSKVIMLTGDETDDDDSSSTGENKNSSVPNLKDDNPPKDKK